MTQLTLLCLVLMTIASFDHTLASDIVTVTDTDPDIDATCTASLNVVLWDLYGDSWNEAQFFMEKPNSTGPVMYNNAPDCEHNPLMLKVQPDFDASANGLYYMTVKNVNNEDLPHEWWEV